MSDDDLLYFIGCNHPERCHHFDPVMISVNGFFRRRDNQKGWRGRRYTLRQSDFEVRRWLMDSGAFVRISRQFGYKNHMPTKTYAAIARRFSTCGELLGVVTQDYMCEDFVLDVTGLTIAEHQRLTLHRYDRLIEELDGSGLYVMPVLQGYKPEEYVSHIRQYGDRLSEGAWVGVGSVCKRNGSPEQVRILLQTIKRERPDLRLHGFGLKKNCLYYEGIRSLLHSSDSQAHDFWGAKTGKKYRYSNNPGHALKYREAVLNKTQLELSFMLGDRSPGEEDPSPPNQ